MLLIMICACMMPADNDDNDEQEKGEQGKGSADEIEGERKALEGAREIRRSLQRATERAWEARKEVRKILLHTNRHYTDLNRGLHTKTRA